MESALRPTDYYRLPWTLNDNVLAWLEPTKRCNLACEGCYSRNDPNSESRWPRCAHLEVFRRNRRIDPSRSQCGDPLVHPDIVEIVRMIRHDFGYKRSSTPTRWR
jgi:MoaA/NifB/PqqE/SkfB family radical SAM enzyme